MINKLFTKATLIRTLSSVLLLAVALFTLIMGGNILFVTMFVVSLIGQFELYRVISRQKSLVGILGYMACIGYYLLLLLEMQEFAMLLMIVFLMVIMAA